MEAAEVLASAPMKLRGFVRVASCCEPLCSCGLCSHRFMADDFAQASV